MGGELVLGAERKSSEKLPRSRKAEKTPDCHHISPFPGSRHIPVPNVTSTIQSRLLAELDLARSFSNASTRQGDQPCLSGNSYGTHPVRREIRYPVLTIVRCRLHLIFPKSSPAMSAMMFCSTQSTASAALSSTDPRSSTPSMVRWLARFSLG